MPSPSGFIRGRRIRRFLTSCREGSPLALRCSPVGPLPMLELVRPEGMRISNEASCFVLADRQFPEVGTIGKNFNVVSFPCGVYSRGSINTRPGEIVTSRISGVNAGRRARVYHGQPDRDRNLWRLMARSVLRKNAMPLLREFQGIRAVAEIIQVPTRFCPKWQLTVIYKVSKQKAETKSDPGLTRQAPYARLSRPAISMPAPASTNTMLTACGTLSSCCVVTPT